jgi:flagellar protein FlaF
MSANANRQNGYVTAARFTGTPRDVEYQVFASITGRLNRMRSASERYAELVDAVHDNLTLWRTIALDVMEPDNALQPELRARLFYLYEFTVAHTQKVLRNEADCAPLIEVNTSIMRGLRSNTQNKA